MSERIIDEADLGRIESQLGAIAASFRLVSNRLDDLDHRLNANETALATLLQEFQKFREADEKVKSVQLAETRLVKLRQELEQRFGHYDEVRRAATGIIQAVGIGVVQHDTVRAVSEEQMILTPRYWLAPAVVALAAWARDERALTQRAVDEAVRRSALKACLFFALVCRRAGRFAAARAWLEQYFGLVDPRQIRREMAVLIEAYVEGIFGPDPEGTVIGRIRGWLPEGQAPKKAVDRWVSSLAKMAVDVPEDEFPYLRKHSPTWPKLARALAAARAHAAIRRHFEDVFREGTEIPGQVAAGVDDLLDRLVRDFDEEELPFRREERRLSLIVAAGGDKERAEAEVDAESSAMDKGVNLLRRLADWSLHPEASGSSRAVQRFATALSRDLILEAHDQFTARNRAGVPREIQLKIEDWKGSTRDGSNEAELLDSITRHVEERKAEALRRIPDFGLPTVLAIAALVALIAWPGILTAGFMAFSVISFIARMSSRREQAKKVEQLFRESLESSQELVRALCAEVVDWRRAYAEADAQAEDTRSFLEEIQPEQYVVAGRATLRPAAPEPGPGREPSFPDWDPQPAQPVLVRRTRNGGSPP